jgi:hypothetical protein
VWGAQGVDQLFDLRSRRDRWLTDLSLTADRYLRSPAFLELMKFNLRAMSLPLRFVTPPSPTGETSHGHHNPRSS